MPFTATQRELVQSLLEPLQHRFLALEQVLPLALDTKSRLPEIAAEFGVAKHLIQKALGILTDRSAYQQALVAPDSVRYTLEGVPVEPVMAEHRAFAQSKLEGVSMKRQRATGPPRRSDAAPSAPASTLLTPDLLREILTMAIPGKLDLTLKVNELPTVKSLGQTVAFAVQAEGLTVLVELKNKAWNNWKTAAAGYPHWVAALAGKMGPAVDAGFRLENPIVQIFEKKSKAVATESPLSPPTPVVTPAVVVTSNSPTAVVTQTVVAQQAPTPVPGEATPLPNLHVSKPVMKLRKPGV